MVNVGCVVGSGFEIWHEIGRPQFQLNFIIKKRFWHLVFLPPSPNKRLKFMTVSESWFNIGFDWQYDTWRFIL